MKMLKLLGISAVLFLSALACSKEPKDVNPNYDPIAKAVTAKFVLNVSTGTGKDTKTTYEYAQVGGAFLGMDQVHLLTYDLNYSPSVDGKFLFKPMDPSSVATRDFDLGQLFTASDLTDSEGHATNSRTLELTLPLETNAVVLYGKALKEKSSDLQGWVSTAGDPANLSTLEFKLQPRMSDSLAFNAIAFVYSRMLTSLTAAGLVNETNFFEHQTGTKDRSYAFWWPIDENTPTNKEGVSNGATETNASTGRVYTFHSGQLAWKQLGRMYDYAHDGDNTTDPMSVANMALSGLGETLGEAYSNLTNIKSKESLRELRAGSASAILRTLRDLSTIVEKVYKASPTGWEENVAKLLAAEIKDRIALYTEDSGDALVFKSSDKIKENLANYVNPTDYTSYMQSLVASKFTDAALPTSTTGGFPLNIGLPYGAAILSCERLADTPAGKMKVDQFDYQKKVPAYAMGNETFPINNYCYPAELMYYGNSPIYVSDEVHSQADFPATIESWSNPANWAGDWTRTNAKVSSTTRSVAMKYSINYGTALLRSYVKYKDGLEKLQDNRNALFPGEGNSYIDITGNRGFKVTGIVVGGQPETVSWQYTRKGKAIAGQTPSYNSSTKMFEGVDFSENPFNKMVYDKVTYDYKVGTTTSDERLRYLYTLVWDNYDASLPADQQSDVYIALELVNDTDNDFWGELNLIRKGGTFYLIGKLKLSDAIAAAQSNSPGAFSTLTRSDYCYPPYNPSTGATIDAPRVFMQDYMTTANLIIDETSLQHAYVTVPDLRSSQVSLGLSIDLDWKAGLAFDVTMGNLN